MIGASALSLRAAKLEAAANAEDTGMLKTDHSYLMEEYEVVTAVIRSVISRDELDADDGTVTEYSDDDEVMEFLPSNSEE